MNKIHPISEIDVVIPVYNGERFLKATLDSVLSQTLQPKSIIVVNDGSTDRTSEIIQDYASRHSSIQLIQQTNHGLSGARNTGILASKSEYIAFLDADDLWLPEKLEQQMEIFQKSDIKNLGLVYTQTQDIDEDGTVYDTPRSYRLDPKIRGDVRSFLLVGNVINGSGSAVLVRRECFNQVGLFNTHLPTGEDWDMWYRIACCYGVDYTPQTVTCIRKTRGSMSSNQLKMLQGSLIILESMAATQSISPAVRREWRRIYFINTLWAILFEKLNPKRTPKLAPVIGPHLNRILKEDAGNILIDAIRSTPRRIANSLSR